MGLDSMGSSLMETQKLSFEEQPDTKVKPDGPRGCAVAPRGDPDHARAGLSLASPHALNVTSPPSLGCRGPSFLAIAPCSSLLPCCGTGGSLSSRAGSPALQRALSFFHIIFSG